MENSEAGRYRNRASTLDAVARIVNAFLACGQLTTAEIVDKAAVGHQTARRTMRAFIKEGLIERVDAPWSHSHIFRWTDKK